jgi:hypothetical protein
MSKAEEPTVTPFKTDDLISAAFLFCQGHEPTRTERIGNFITFIFEELDAQKAAALLGGAERSLCLRYTHAWRSLRRRIEEIQRSGGSRR